MLRNCRECDTDFDPRTKRNGGLSIHCDDCSLETTSRATEKDHPSALAVHSTNPGKWGAERGEVKAGPPRK